MITADDIAYALERLKAKQGNYKLYADYYGGNQRLAFATDSFRNAFGYLFNEFAYNRSSAVVDAVADRLQITGWETDKDESTESPIEKAAGELWRRNRMTKRQGEVHTEALRSGNAFVTVWPDEGTSLVRLTPNPGHVMQVVYDDEYGDTIAYAVKTWCEDRGENKGRWRVTVYEPDIIRRFITTGKKTEMPVKMTGLIPYTDDEQPETPNDYGRVPVFHFANNANCGDDGYSELVDIIPLQDALNKVLMDSLIAGEFLGFPQRVISGLEPTIDPVTGKAEKPFDIAMDRLVLLGDAAAKWGQFDAADMTQFSSMQNEYDLKIARVSRVPVHWINQTGDFPSGESLKVAESPFVSKVIDRQIAYGDIWAAAMQFALEVEAVAGDASGIQPIWQPAESRSETDKLNAAMMKKSIGVPDSQLFAELGYSPEEIDQFKKEKADAQKEQMAQFGQAFNKGQVPVGGD